MVNRLAEWPKLLSNYLEDCANKPFEWGKHDCMAFSAGAVHALTGHNFFPEFSDYNDEMSAFEMLSRHGGVPGIISKCLGNGSRNIMQAGRGNIVIVKMPEIVSGVVDDSGQRIALVSESGGLTRVPLQKGWRHWDY